MKLEVRMLNADEVLVIEARGKGRPTNYRALPIDEAVALVRDCLQKAATNIKALERLHVERAAPLVDNNAVQGTVADASAGCAGR